MKKALLIFTFYALNNIVASCQVGILASPKRAELTIYSIADKKIFIPGTKLGIGTSYGEPSSSVIDSAGFYMSPRLFLNLKLLHNNRFVPFVGLEVGGLYSINKYAEKRNPDARNVIFKPVGFLAAGFNYYNQKGRGFTCRILKDYNFVDNKLNNTYFVEVGITKRSYKYKTKDKKEKSKIEEAIPKPPSEDLTTQRLAHIFKERTDRRMEFISTHNNIKQRCERSQKAKLTTPGVDNEELTVFWDGEVKSGYAHGQGCSFYTNKFGDEFTNCGTFEKGIANGNVQTITIPSRRRNFWIVDAQYTQNQRNGILKREEYNSTANEVDYYIVEYKNNMPTGNLQFMVNVDGRKGILGYNGGESFSGSFPEPKTWSDFVSNLGRCLLIEVATSVTDNPYAKAIIEESINKWIDDRNFEVGNTIKSSIKNKIIKDLEDRGQKAAANALKIVDFGLCVYGN